MNFSHTLLLSAFAITVTTTACSSGTDTASSSETSDVVVARCPSSISLSLGRPVVDETVPKTSFDGGFFSSSEREQIAAAMDHARALRDGVSVALGLDRTAAGRCDYTATSPRVHGRLRTTNGKVIFDVDLGDGLQVYTFPESYSRTGLAFGSHPTASLFANVAASGPFADGATRSVKIGSSPLLGTASEPVGDVVLPPAGGEVELRDGATFTITGGPRSVVFVARSAAVVAKVTSSSLATCTVTREPAASGESRLAIDVEYELDDGFNGCSLVFEGDHFHASASVGLTVGD